MFVDSSNSIIAVDRFIQSTRDSGYKNTSSAIAELVDNALQAGATTISIQVVIAVSARLYPIRVSVADNGEGMNPETLRQALRFGGSSRFNDRNGLGRYGMGLPNASLSQAKRVEVYSWQHRERVYWTYLDVDEISSSQMTEVPVPTRATIPTWANPMVNKSGTMVVWDSCDRLDHRRITTVERKIVRALGQTFRYYLWEGLQLLVNGVPVRPVDPLFLHKNATDCGGSLFQEPEVIEVYRDPDNPKYGTGNVTVTFAELPVAEWHDRPNEEKRKLGITNGAGVSMVRGSREVDFGWFFMGTKRRENYDDWWRCEIRFGPDLDEAFGITHTKQQVRPREHLVEAIQPLVEIAAKALNARVRQAHIQVKAAKSAAGAEAIAESQEVRLKPIPSKSILIRDKARILELSRRNTVVRALQKDTESNAVRYRMIEDDGRGAVFFHPVLGKNVVLGVLNPKHRFFKTLYQPLMELEQSPDMGFARAVQLLLLSAARAEAMFTRSDEHAAIERFRHEWSDVLDVLLSTS